MNKFIKIASLILVLVLSMSVAVFADEIPEFEEPYVFTAETGEFVLNDLSVMGMTTLPANVFQGMEASIKVVKIKDENITAIEEAAFLNCFRLEKVYIPETVTEISDGAFWGCPGDVKIYAPRGSAAEDFAKDNGFSYKEYSGEEKNTEGNISDGISVTILGVGVVFLILIILCLVLKVFEIAFGSQKKAPAPAPVQAPKAAAPAPAPAQDDTELVAVISAAIAASLGTSTSSFRIKSLRRLGSGWNQAAKIQNFNNNF